MQEMGRGAARRIRQTILRTVGLGAVVFLVAGPMPNASAADPPRHTEQLSVREVEVVFEPPQLPPDRKSLADLQPQDFQVLDQGVKCPVVRVEPIGATSGTWVFRVYFDLTLAKPTTVFRSAVALAARVPRLLQLGSVEILVADPQPQRVLEASRDAQAIEAVLSDIAGRAGQKRSSEPTYSKPLDPSLLRVQCDRMLTALAGNPPAGPHALFWVVDPIYLATDAVAQLGRETSPTPSLTDEKPRQDPSGAAATLASTARVLSGYGWVALAMPMRGLSGTKEKGADDDMLQLQRTLQSAPTEPNGARPAGGSFTPLIMAFINKLRGNRLPQSDLRLIAPQLDAENVALAAFVRPTAGILVPYRETFDVALDGLAQRWHLWYQADAEPHGNERSLVVTVPSRPQVVRAQVWVRSSVPTALTVARAGALLAGDSLQDLAISVSVSQDASGGWTVHAAQANVADLAGGGPLRITLVNSSGETVVQTLPEANIRTWDRSHQLTFSVPKPELQGKVAVVFEDLGSERWGEAVLADGH
jgi:hypothetical protein